jgi:hydroxyacylglutathione hydrolase
MPQIIPIAVLKDNYVWLIINHDQAIIVDPGEANPVLKQLKERNLKLAAIFLTHHHGDHSAGIPELLQHFPKTPVFAGQTSQLAFVTHHLADQEEFYLPEFEQSWQAIAIPGHTLDHTAFYQAPILFTGDTLFTAGCGRIFEGTPEMMFNSLAKLAALPDQTQIYCGHEYTLSNLKFALAIEPQNQAIQARFNECEKLRQQDLPTVPASLELEKQTNPFLRYHESTVKQAVSMHLNNDLTDPIAVFAALRAWKNLF